MSHNESAMKRGVPVDGRLKGWTMPFSFQVALPLMLDVAVVEGSQSIFDT